MTYYKEVRGERFVIGWIEYEELLLDGWSHIIQQPGLAIIGKKNV